MANGYRIDAIKKGQYNVEIDLSKWTKDQKQIAKFTKKFNRIYKADTDSRSI